MRRVMMLLAAMLLAGACTDDTVVGSNNGGTNNGPGNNGQNNNNGQTNNSGGPDSDGDGISDADEAILGTNPNVADTDGDGLTDGDELNAGTNPRIPDSDGDGFLDGSEVIAGSDPTVQDEACGLDRYTASLEEKPVDIIFVIDNSGSMGDEIRSVETNVNQNFADIIRNSGLDFRVIMVSEHGPNDAESICISSPLSGTNCNPIPAQPANTANFFHYDVTISSHNSFQRILTSYNTPDTNGFTQLGWSEWLRDEAFKVFVEITDDDPTGSLPDGNPADAVSFEAALFALQPPHFGEPGKRNYIWHSIIGMAGNGGAAWQPTDPIVNQMCNTGESAAPEYQKLSIATGGLRYPVCDFQSYDVVFNQVALGIIEQSRIGCELDLPEAPEGSVIDVESMILEWTPSPGAPAQQVTKIDAAQCVGRNFAIQGDSILLCSELCAEVAASTEGSLSILAGCTVDGGGGDECVPTAPYELECNDGIDNDCDGFLDRDDIECLQ